MKTINIIAIATTGSVLIFFMILITYAIYGIIIYFTEQSTIINFKNFAISNVVLIIIGSVFFIINIIALYMVFNKLIGEESRLSSSILLGSTATTLSLNHQVIPGPNSNAITLSENDSDPEISSSYSSMPSLVSANDSDPEIPSPNSSLGSANDLDPEIPSPNSSLGSENDPDP